MSSSPRALICGVSGQDGAYLSKFLLDRGYEVHGTSRDAGTADLRNFDRLEIAGQISVSSMSPTDLRSVLAITQQVRPTEIYNLSGQSSVSLSFDQPVETIESISVGTLNLLEAIRFSKLPIRFYSAGSGEVFGDTGGTPADELTRFAPRSPYAVAKAAAYWSVANYREGYGLYACTGILFNHESPLRPERFVTRKIVAAACRIAQGSDETLVLGDMDIARDWGFAGDYVEAMWRMLQQDKPGDFVIATGKTHTLREFVSEAFSGVGLDWNEHVRTDPALYRPTEIRRTAANPSQASRTLGWKSQHDLSDLVRMMVAAESSQIKESSLLP